MRKRYCAVLLISLTVLLSGCYNFGPGRVPGAQYGYTEAVARSADEQMLLNLVRLRYQRVPVFLALTSVLTQYSYLGSIGVAGESGSELGKSLWSVGGRAGVAYAERPTFTFSPLAGEEFAKQLLRPIPAHKLFSLVQSGWPPERLLMMGMVQINHLENLPFNRPPNSKEIQELRSFHRVVELILDLDRRHALELYLDEAVTPPVRYLVLDPDADAEAPALVDEFKSTLRLDPQRDVFRVTDRLPGRKPGEIVIRLRSFLGLMGYVARGVEVPEPHVKEERVLMLGSWLDNETREFIFPMHVYTEADEPESAFVRVRYQDHWFYLKHSDHRSKRAFGLLTYLFQLQAPTPSTRGPILTLPAGG